MSALDAVRIRYGFREPGNPTLPPDLDRRIRAMAIRWNLSTSEFSEVIALARRNPLGWLAAVALDEARFGTRDVRLTADEIRTGMRDCSAQ